MSPCVVFAWKFGASEPNLNRGCSDGVARYLRKTGDAWRGAKEDCEARVMWEVVRSALRANEVAMIELCLRTGL